MTQPRPARSAPQRITLPGRYVRLEPLDSEHVETLYQASSGEGTEARFAYLFEPPPASPDMLLAWVERQSTASDPLYFAIVDSQTGHCLGRQALMRIVPDHGVIEIGGILWGRDMARTQKATEAFYLAARHIFDDLGYRRFEWKCNALNQPSRRAAARFGFHYEGTFRQHMIIKGENRDTAWFAMLDGDWPAIRTALEAWLDPQNFDAAGQQRNRLALGR